MSLAPPPALPPFGTSYELLRALNDWARPEGYGVIRRRSLSIRNGVSHRYDLTCSRGGRYWPSRSSGLRRSSTSKTGCPWAGKALKRVGCDWTFEMLNPSHNHPPDPLEGSEIVHRRRTWIMRQRHDVQSKIREGVGSGKIVDMLRREHPGQVWNRRDIENEKAKMRREGLL